jgi:transposase
LHLTPFDVSLSQGVSCAMKRPQEVKLSREDSEALMKRLEGNALTPEDRHVLGQVLRWYFWLLFTLQEAKLSLKRLRVMLFGAKPTKRHGGAPGESSPAGGSDGGRRVGLLAAGEQTTAADANANQPSPGGHRPGHGRQGAEAYVGAERVECRHEALAVGERCPVCGLGRLYQVPPGVELRIDGNALLPAIRYELAKLRCSACGQVFTAALPEEAGQERYSPRARAVLAVSRYYLGVPLYRLEG